MAPESVLLTRSASLLELGLPRRRWGHHLPAALHSLVLEKCLQTPWPQMCLLGLTSLCCHLIVHRCEASSYFSARFYYSHPMGEQSETWKISESQHIYSSARIWNQVCLSRNGVFSTSLEEGSCLRTSQGIPSMLHWARWI